MIDAFLTKSIAKASLNAPEYMQKCQSGDND